MMNSRNNEITTEILLYIRWYMINTAHRHTYVHSTPTLIFAELVFFYCCFALFVFFSLHSRFVFYFDHFWFMSEKPISQAYAYVYYYVWLFTKRTTVLLFWFLSPSFGSDEENFVSTKIEHCNEWHHLHSSTLTGFQCPLESEEKMWKNQMKPNDIFQLVLIHRLYTRKSNDFIWLFSLYREWQTKKKNKTKQERNGINSMNELDECKMPKRTHHIILLIIYLSIIDSQKNHSLYLLTPIAIQEAIANSERAK